MQLGESNCPDSIISCDPGYPGGFSERPYQHGCSSPSLSHLEQRRDHDGGDAAKSRAPDLQVYNILQGSK